MGIGTSVIGRPLEETWLIAALCGRFGGQRRVQRRGRLCGDGEDNHGRRPRSVREYVGGVGSMKGRLVFFVSLYPYST